MKIITMKYNQSENSISLLTLFATTIPLFLNLRLPFGSNCDARKVSAFIISAMRADVDETGNAILQTFDNMEEFEGNSCKTKSLYIVTIKLFPVFNVAANEKAIKDYSNKQ